MSHEETHRTHRIGWLRAAVLGANDGIISTASLIIGVAAAQAGRTEVLTAGIAGLVAGAMSMACGEYVSVSSQADIERADIERERRELAEDEEKELAELAGIYVRRGLQPALAKRVAEELHAHDAVSAHVRDELGITEIASARPVQAALASAGTFAVGAGLPLSIAALFSPPSTIPVVGVTTLASLALLGVLGARAGGAPIGRAAVRVTFWGALAMLATAGIGRLVGVMV